jgi:hypothetical protein
MDAYSEYVWWSVRAAIMLRDNCLYMREICNANAIGWASR